MTQSRPQPVLAGPPTSLQKPLPDSTSSVRNGEYPVLSTELTDNYMLPDDGATEKILGAQKLSKTVQCSGNPVMKWDVNVLPTKAATEIDMELILSPATF